MPQVYTHDFILKFDGFDVDGEIEFDDDGIAGYKTNDPMPYMSLGQQHQITQLFEQLKLVYNAFGGLKKILIKEKSEA